MPGESIVQLNATSAQCKLRIYAIMSSLSTLVSVNIGIPACGVVWATINAVLVISAVAARSTNLGERAFGERSCPAAVA
jgi:hypothetical protein